MPRNNPPSFDFYPEDFLAGTMHMHPFAVGMYIRLLCYQWSHGSIPTDDRQLVQITGAMPDELSDHLADVMDKFEEQEDGRLINQRLAGEWMHKQKVRQARSEAGAKGRAIAPANAQAIAETNEATNGQQKNSKSGRWKVEGGSNQKEETKAFRPDSLPLPFDSDELRVAWANFCQMRREIRKPLKPTGAKQSIARLEEMGVERAVAALRHTTANEWQGIREPDQRATAAKPGSVLGI